MGKPRILPYLNYNNEQTLRMVIMPACVSRADDYCDAISGYGGDILLVGINYSEKAKAHPCQIEKFEYNHN